MKYSLVFWLLLVPALAHGQIPGAIPLAREKPTAAEIEKARKTMDAARAPEPVRWEVGVFQILVRGQYKGPVKFDALDEKVLVLEEVPVDPKTGLTPAVWIEGIRAGETEKHWHKFDPQKESYWIARAAQAGVTVVKVWANGASGAEPPYILVRLDVQVGKPKPPEPPGPNPPGPTPIPAQGLRVLIVFEKDQAIPPPQSLVLSSQLIADYLKAKCAKENGRPEYRIFDKDTDVKGQSAIWQEAMKRPRQGTPWILISDGKTGYEGMLPDTVEATLKLLKQYGGE